MAVLSRISMQLRMRLPISDPRCFVVTPLVKRDQAFDEDAIDLRLGSHFLLPQQPPEPYNEPNSKSRVRGHQRIHIPLGACLVVPAHQTVLGCTLEFIKLPFDVAGEILTKSSVARTFIVIETAPWIHPYYRGCLTLEIANVSNTPLLLYPGRPIGQLVLMDVDRPTVPQKITGQYLGPVYPEAPKFADPSTDLADLGVKLRPPRILR